MSPERMLFMAGVALLATAALIGFKQYRERERPEAFARWRVVHAGGTGGGIQLIALGTAFGHFDVHGTFASWVSAGVASATLAFFLGPLSQALRWPRTGSLINTVGAVLAVPAYLALPLVAAGGG